MKVNTILTNITQNLSQTEKDKAMANIGIGGGGSVPGNVISTVTVMPDISTLKKDTAVLYLGANTGGYEFGKIYIVDEQYSNQTNYYLIKLADGTPAPIWYVRDFAVGARLYTATNPPVINTDLQYYLSYVDKMDLGDTYTYYMEVSDKNGNPCGEWESDEVDSTEKYPTPILVTGSGTKTKVWKKVL